MAKLGSYYGLCPLIDQKSLLGISEDATTGCVVVTLGKNMAIKYKLSDQKQLDSWSTKEKLSSPVVYDKKSEKYVAVFNQNFLRLWKEGEKNLEKIRKIKFSIPLHTVLPCDDESLVVFKTGQIFKLSDALENRKDIIQEDIIDKTHTIENETCVKVNDKYYVGLLIKNNSLYYYLWIENNENVKKIPIERDGFNLIGHLVSNTDNGTILYTVWSDGRMFTYPIFSNDESTQSPGTFYSVIETLSRKHNICMVSLNNNYIAMYGADSNQEGASLQIYNTQFKVTQSKQQFKMYSEGSKLWLIKSSLLLTVGQNLAVVPFHLDTEQLAALVGSHKLVATGSDEDLAIVTEVTLGQWESECDKQNGIVIPDGLKKEIKSFINEGWSETAICQEIFPKLIENKDDKTIINSVDYFVDIPETILVKLISYSLTKHLDSPDVINNGLKHTELLDRLLAVSYSDVLLLPYLKYGLNFNETLILLKYICFMLSENGRVLPNLDVTKTEEKLIDIGCLLIDSHYQQLLLTKDDSVLSNLMTFKQLADNYYNCLEEFKKVEPILSRLKRGKIASKLSNVNLKYSVEKIKLY